MTVTDSAYIAVLENKLAQAERNLYEFRQIFTHWQSSQSDAQQVQRTEPSGLAEEKRSHQYLAQEEEECVE
jgi:hypothetical protein